MRTWERAASATLATLTLGVWLPAGPDLSMGEGPFETAGQAAGRIPFSAHVVVRWVDQAGAHLTEVDVSTGEGLVRLEGPAAVVIGSGTPLRTNWLRVWTDPADRGKGPDVAGKYQVESGPGPAVAGRPTHLVLLRSGGRLRERLAVDRDSGLVLRREVMAPDGQVHRAVTVERLDTGTGAGADVHGHHRHHAEPAGVRPDAVPPPYRAPAALAGGYQRLGVYHDDRLVHQVYSDGLYGISLFTRSGDLSWRQLPPGGEEVRLGGRGRGVRYGWPGGELVAWQAGPVVRVLVGDAPLEEMLAVARSLPVPGRPSWGARLRTACRRVVEAVSGGP